MHGGLLKHDLETGTTTQQTFGGGVMAMEPVFVPAATTRMTAGCSPMCTISSRDACDIQVLHAQDFGGAPVATIHLPHRVPFGLHCNWVPDDSDAD